MLSRPSLVLAGSFLAFFLTLAAHAQGDSLRTVIAEQRVAMAMADSAGDLKAAFHARLALAELAKQPEAIVLFGEAAALADSLGRPDLGGMVHRMFAARRAAWGQHALAYAELLRADTLDLLRELHEMAEARQAFDLERQGILKERDELLQAAAERERTMAQAIVVLQEKADRWMMAALALCLVGLLSLAALVYRGRRVTARLQSSIDALRGQVEQLKAQQEGKAAPAPEPGPRPTAMDEAMRPVVEGIFQKAAPERLTTLRAARQRRDTEKILRVVASLKPQLLAFDAGRFDPLIKRLRAPGAADDPKQWKADLDALEQGVEEWAGREGTGG